MYGFLIAFERYSPALGISGSKWVGLANINRFFSDPYFARMVRNTVLLSVYSLLWSFPMPIILAISINEAKNRVFKRTVQSVSYFPNFVSVVFVVMLLKNFTSENGIINVIIKSFSGHTVQFFSSYAWFRTLYIASGIWQGVGFGSILYIGAISGISHELYEAAHIDGCNKLKEIWHITLPSILPTIVIMFIISVSGIFNVATEKVLLMYNPGIYAVSDVVGTYMYRLGLISFDFSYSTAVGFVQTVLSFMLVLLANYLSRRLTETSLW
jgi:putative aldouronate transport system permease protein